MEAGVEVRGAGDFTRDSCEWWELCLDETLNVTSIDGLIQGMGK